MSQNASASSFDRFSGTVTAVSTTTLTVANAEAGAREFTVNASTRFQEGRDPGTVAAIHVGDRVTVETLSGDLTALVVALWGDSPL